MRRVGVVGGGPRGLGIAERLIANSTNQEESVEELTITLFDPYGPGGNVWRPNQKSGFLMNSVAQQVTLFTDESVMMEGPVKTGPNLYQWAKTEAADFIAAAFPVEAPLFLAEVEDLRPDQVTSRALYGIYQQWFFQKLRQKLPPNVRLRLVAELVTDLTGKGPHIVKTATGEFSFDQLVFATGHYENQTADNEFSRYAAEHQLFYQPPQNAAMVSTEEIPPGAVVIIRGLGLAFFDYIEHFAQQRGGRFVQERGKLRYQKSGREVKIYAGSGRGLPYHPRGSEEKTVGQQYSPDFLTPEKVMELKQATEGGTEFFHLLKKEVELTYYQRLITEENLPIDVVSFSQKFVETPNSEHFFAAYPRLREKRWDWSQVAEPFTDSKAAFTDFLPRFLAWQINEAQKGNLSGAYTSAFEKLKDLRNPVREMLTANALTPEEQAEDLLKWLTPLNSFLTIGPPIRRSEELLALIEAGVIELVGPEMEVVTKDGHFITYDSLGTEIVADYLIEARIPANDLTETKNPLWQNLRAQGMATEFILAVEPPVKTGAVNVDLQTWQLIDQNQRPQANLYCYGIPCEGVDWLTAAVSTPQTNAWNFQQADRIARQILATDNSDQMKKPV